MDQCMTPYKLVMTLWTGQCKAIAIATISSGEGQARAADP
jgi:hypothetical protein